MSGLGLEGLTVLVTGAAGGIGRALAQAFAGAGSQLALTARQGHDALAADVAAGRYGTAAAAFRADVTRPDEIDAACRAAAARFGRLDACIVNAGTWPPEALRLDQLAVERVRETLEVNLAGALWTARAFLRELAAHGPRADRRGASLTFIGSTAGRFGEKGHVDYAASKAALRGIVLTLKNEIVELDPYGRVNMVEPGWTVTPMAAPALAEPGTVSQVVRTMPLAQLARPEDIARAVLFLSSPHAARHVSGEILTVAGGMEGRVQHEPGTIDEARVAARLSEE